MPCITRLLTALFVGVGCATWALGSPDTLAFHTYSRMCRELDSLALAYPAILRIETLATTPTGGRAVIAARVSNEPAVTSGEPAVLFTGIHHGCEVIGAEICLALLDSLLTGCSAGPGRRLVDSLQITIVPMVNPDGHEVNFSTSDTWWRKNARDNNGNGHFDSGDGVDINRNYPFLWDSGGSALPTGREYRGPYALSEVESRALTELAGRERFVAEICYHSDQDSVQGECVYYPWSWDGDHSPDYRFIRPIAESIAASITSDGGGRYVPIIGYANSGGMFRNWAYYTYGTFSHTIEVSRGYYPPSSRVDSLCSRNLPGAFYLLNRALGPGIRGRVTDSLSGEPLAAIVELLEADTGVSHPILPRRTEHGTGSFYRLLASGLYHLRIACPGYRTRTVGPIIVNEGGLTRVDVALVRLPPGWQEVNSLPPGASERPVSDGGWLATSAGTGLIYAARGNKTTEFYRYDPADPVWIGCASIPSGREAKGPGKGAVGCSNGGDAVYATKGNNTQGFYRYVAARDSWCQLSDVPLGTTNKKVKGGTDMVYVPEAEVKGQSANGKGQSADRGFGPGTLDLGLPASAGCVYLLKGRKNEFWRYRPDGDSWTSLAAAPLGTSGKDKYDKGSWLVCVDSIIYCHKAKYHELFAYDIAGNRWSGQLGGMPFVGMLGKSKKSKDGGSAAWFGGSIYALKGGNTQELWRYDPGPDSWHELDTLPLVGSAGRKRKVKAGGGIVAADDALYALKGNKTNEFWRYVPASAVDGGTATVDASTAAGLRFAVLPNPTRPGFATVRWSGLGHDPASPGRIGSCPAPVMSLRVYDATGRLVLHWSSGVVNSPFPLDLRSLRAGVYMVKLSTDMAVVTQKLVIQR